MSPFRPHLLLFIISCAFCEVGFSQKKTGDALLSEGRTLHNDAYYDSAIVVFNQAVNVFQSSGSVEKILEAHYARAESFSNLGSCDKADSIARFALSQTIENFGISSIQTANGYYYLSRTLGGCARKFKEAISYNLKAIEIKSELYDPQSIEMVPNYEMMGYYYNSLGNYDSAEYYLNKSFAIRKKEQAISSVEYSHALNFLAKTYENKGDLKRALDLGIQSLEIRKALLRPDHPTISNSLNDIGNVYKKLGNVDEALGYFLPALELRKRSLGDQHVNVAASYYSIGNLYGNLFNYRRAIHYLEQGNRIIEAKLGESLPVLHTYLAYLGRMYGKVGQDEEAMRLLDKAERLAEKYLEDDHPYLGIIYDIIGQYYSEQDSGDSETLYLKKALKIYRVAYGKDHPREAEVLVKLGETSLKRNDPDQSIGYYEQALDIIIKRNGKWNSVSSGIYQHIGDWHMANEDYEKAQDYFLKAIKALAIDTALTGSNWSNEQLIHPHAALRAIHRLANSYAKQFEKTDNINHLQIATSYFNKAVSLASYISSGYQLEVSKAQLAKETRVLFQDAIRTCFRLYERTEEYAHKAQVFGLIEQSKSPILLEVVVDSEAKRYNNLPDSLLSKERNLKVELTYFKEKLKAAKSSSGQSDQVDFYQEKAFQTQSEIEDLKQHLIETYPRYYNFKYSNRVISIEQLQKQLPLRASLIEFFEGSSEYYVVLVNHDLFEINKLSIGDNFNELLMDYQRSLTDNNLIVLESEKADSLYGYTAHALYKQLLQPLLDETNDTDKLIIIPDGKLAQINFGTLLIEQPTVGFKYGGLNYLLRTKSISYGYSSTLNFRSIPRVAGRLFGGFAPSYDAEGYMNIDSIDHPLAYQLVRSGNLPLPGAISEVTTIRDLLKGSAWLKTEATESAFKNNASNYRILHLAMHSLLDKTDPEYSELLFNNEDDTLNDGYLTISEIYNLKLNAQLAVLSACSSGSGELQAGEGPISFTRAFSYAGCPSVVMSMWKLPDAATKEIMIAFYRFIEDGMSKDEALRMAQLGYLEKTNDPLYQHPFFWGSFVAMGDTSPIVDEFSHSKLLIFIVSALFVLAIAIIGVRKRHASRAHA